MISSYQFSRSFDPLSILTGAVGALWSILRLVALLLLGAVALAGLFAVVVALWVPICQFCGALAIIAAFGWATFPRAKVTK